MADDNSKQDERDRSRVAGDENYEVQHFAQEAGISPKQARTLIKRHGHDRAELAELAKSVRRSAQQQG